MNELFKDYIESFKGLDTKDKREAIIDSVKELIAIFEELSVKSNISLEYLQSREILDLKTSDTEDEYLEALLVYIENAKNIIGQYMDNKM